MSNTKYFVLAAICAAFIFILGQCSVPHMEREEAIQAIVDEDCNTHSLAVRDCYDLDMTPGTEAWTDCMEESISYWEHELYD